MIARKTLGVLLVGFLWGALTIGLLSFYLLPERVITVQVNPFSKVEEQFILKVSDKYKVRPFDVSEIYLEAREQGNQDTFPTKLDLLAIVAIESSFNKHAKSAKGAHGPMQIRYKPSGSDIHQNISDGKELLDDYYARVKSPRAALQAYNLGITNFKKGKRNLRYVAKFQQAKAELKELHG